MPDAIVVMTSLVRTAPIPERVCQSHFANRCLYWFGLFEIEPMVGHAEIVADVQLRVDGYKAKTLAAADLPEVFRRGRGEDF